MLLAIVNQRKNGVWGFGRMIEISDIWAIPDLKNLIGLIY